MLNPKFKIEFLEDALEFLESIDEKARDKIIYNITKAQFSNNKELFRKLTNNIWEFRTLFNKTYYRLFAFWDKSLKTDTIVIITHGLKKQTDKTPRNDLLRAERLRSQYFEENDINK